MRVAAHARMRPGAVDPVVCNGVNTFSAVLPCGDDYCTLSLDSVNTVGLLSDDQCHQRTSGLQLSHCGVRYGKQLPLVAHLYRRVMHAADVVLTRRLPTRAPAIWKQHANWHISSYERRVFLPGGWPTMLHRDLHSLSVHTGGPLAAPDDHDDPPRLWRCDNVHGSGRERNR